MKRGFWVRALAGVAVVIAVPLLVLNACVESYSWKEKVTLVVETPSGLKTGSSIVEVGLSFERFLPGHPGGRTHISIRGESPFVEIAPGRYIFSLIYIHSLKGSANPLAPAVLQRELPSDYPERGRELSRLNAKKVLNAQQYPILVTFDDLRYPDTVRRLESSDFRQIFGPGVRLREIVLETNPAEGEAEKKLISILPWLCQHEGYLDGASNSSRSAKNRFANSISPSSFILGGC